MPVVALGGVRVTEAAADLVGSAMLVAVMVVCKGGLLLELHRLGETGSRAYYVLYNILPA